MVSRRRAGSGTQIRNCAAACSPNGTRLNPTRRGDSSRSGRRNRTYAHTSCPQAERILVSRQPAIGGQIIWLQRGSFVTSHVGAHLRSERKSSAKACIKISITEGFLQSCEHGLARAVA